MSDLVGNPNCWFSRDAAHLSHTIVLYYSRVEISKKGELYKMIIKNLAETDAGEYMCKVGDRPTKCQVTVEECK